MQQRIAASEQEIASLRDARAELVAERDQLKTMMEDVLGNLAKSGEGGQGLFLSFLLLCFCLTLFFADVRDVMRHLEANVEELQRQLAERNTEVEALRSENSTLKFLVEESNNMH